METRLRRHAFCGVHSEQAESQVRRLAARQYDLGGMRVPPSKHRPDVAVGFRRLFQECDHKRVPPDEAARRQQEQAETCHRRMRRQRELGVDRRGSHPEQPSRALHGRRGRPRRVRWARGHNERLQGRRRSHRQVVEARAIRAGPESTFRVARARAAGRSQQPEQRDKGGACQAGPRVPIQRHEFGFQVNVDGVLAERAPRRWQTIRLWDLRLEERQVLHRANGLRLVYRGLEGQLLPLLQDRRLRRAGASSFRGADGGTGQRDVQ
mmetsp:Transcript_123524/g.349197  ORF Transcript_123524/g.349197 Transcript_123524/m.349197 type:complete len:266 (-) Transcript_123524:779-1576(-)